MLVENTERQLPDPQPFAPAEIWRLPLPELKRVTDRLLTRTFCTLALHQVYNLEGWGAILPIRDPFLLVANHSSRREAVYLPALLLLLRGGRPVHFLADWNFRLIPGVGKLYKRSGAITVTRKDARPRILNGLKPFFMAEVPPREQAARAECPEQRSDALQVLRSTYQEEKRWVAQAESQLPESDLGSEKISWFVAYRRGRPAGVLRVYYDPPLYRSYDNKLVRDDIDVEQFLRGAATRETVERGFTHYITDVFEDDPHSPYHFHTMVMGFNPVATHDHGELTCTSRRITLILDLKAAYQRLRRRKSWIFRSLTKDWDEQLQARLAL
ncbi:MAG: 1-acyl-sn-glycerol-3-phosphate acyltransferase [Chromatiaceae bacterium]